MRLKRVASLFVYTQEFMKFSTQKFAQLIIFLYLCAVNDANDENMQSNHSIHLTYSRTSVCAADDYINKSLDIRMPPSATLAHLVDYLLPSPRRTHLTTPIKA